MDKRDCIYPDCQIATDFGFACEHSCEHERDNRLATQRENDAINDLLGGFDTYALGYYVSPAR